MQLYRNMHFHSNMQKLILIAESAYYETLIYLITIFISQMLKNMHLHKNPGSSYKFYWGPISNLTASKTVSI